MVARIVVIGNAAGGKSTLARHLARRRELPLIELDRLLWQPGWQLTPEPDYTRGHAEIIAREQWVIDGLGRQDSIAERLARSTEIVLIDMPLWIHFALAAERQITGRTDGSMIRRRVLRKCRRRDSCFVPCGRLSRPGCRTFAACARRPSWGAKR
jgi:adenylate kinase family enzyme